MVAAALQLAPPSSVCQEIPDSPTTIPWRRLPNEIPWKRLPKSMSPRSMKAPPPAVECQSWEVLPSPTVQTRPAHWAAPMLSSVV